MQQKTNRLASSQLSQIETQLRKAYPRTNLQGLRDFDAVAAARQQHSLPILNRFKAWMDDEMESGRMLPKSEIRKAFTYTLNQWSALCRCTEAGYLSYENYAAERLVKNPAIGRKNFLFVGGERGGHDAAVFYSLVSSAKMNGVEPFAWLRDVFTNCPIAVTVKRSRKHCWRARDEHRTGRVASRSLASISSIARLDD